MMANDPDGHTGDHVSARRLEFIRYIDGFIQPQPNYVMFDCSSCHEEEWWFVDVSNLTITLTADVNGGCQWADARQSGVCNK